MPALPESASIEAARPEPTSQMTHAEAVTIVAQSLKNLEPHVRAINTSVEAITPKNPDQTKKEPYLSVVVDEPRIVHTQNIIDMASSHAGAETFAGWNFPYAASILSQAGLRMPGAAKDNYPGEALRALAEEAGWIGVARPTSQLGAKAIK